MVLCQVVLREIARGLDRDTITNSSGNFLFPTVPPGEYSLRVTKEGFDAAEIKNINLEVGQRASFDLELKVGQIGRAGRAVILAGNLGGSTGYFINVHLHARRPAGGIGTPSFGLEHRSVQAQLQGRHQRLR